MKRLTSVLSAVVLATSLLVGACSKSVEGETKKWTTYSTRVTELSATPGVEQVFVFENRGEAIGVTLHHPHGQIYAYPYITPTTKPSHAPRSAPPGMPPAAQNASATWTTTPNG